jgi:hypothetical protein
MDRVRKPNVCESYTPSSESCSNYLYVYIIGDYCVLCADYVCFIVFRQCNIDVLTRKESIRNCPN